MPSQVQVIEKHTDAALLFSDFDFTDELPGDTSLNAGTSTVTAVDDGGTAAASVVGTVSIVGMSLRAVLQAGTNGQDYRITFKAVGTTTAQVSVKQVEMRVRTAVTGAL